MRSSTPAARCSARHSGVASFTIGQRRGVGVAAGERRYVVDVDTPYRDGDARIPRGAAARRRRRCADLTFVDGAPGDGHAPRAGRARTAIPCPRCLDGIVVRFAEPQPARRAWSSCRSLRRRHRSSVAASRRSCSLHADPPRRGVRSTSSRRTTAISRCVVLDGLGRPPTAAGTEELRRLVEAQRDRAPGGTEPEVENVGRRSRRRRRRSCCVIRSRRNSTGSASVIGSTTTNPAGTTTAHRRERPCSARPEHRRQRKADRECDETEHDASVGEQQRSGDRRRRRRARAREGGERGTAPVEREAGRAARRRTRTRSRRRWRCRGPT